MENLPDIFVVGAAKSGTTALYNYFKHHPDIFVPADIKELNYMAFFDGLPHVTGPGDDEHLESKSIASLSAYQDIFRARGDNQLGADVSPAYLVYPQASGKIAELCPGAKIVIILRNPIECAFSHYSMMKRDRREPCTSFLEAFRLSRQRQATGWEWAWNYQENFLFSGQVGRYLKLFPSGQLFIRRYEELNENPEKFYRELTAFLQVRPMSLDLNKPRFNEAPRRIDVWLQKKGMGLIVSAARKVGKSFPSGLRTVLRRGILEKPAYQLTPAQRRVLVDYYAEDIQKLGAMLQWDLKDWLKV